MVASVDVNLAASSEIAGVAESLAPGSSVESVTNGVETAVFAPTEPTLDALEPGRRRIVVPRRLFEKNGVEYFLRALPLIAERFDVEAVLVGDGPERERLEALARELGIGERVHFLGARPHADMPGILSSAELAVFPSVFRRDNVHQLVFFCTKCFRRV